MWLVYFPTSRTRLFTFFPRFVWFVYFPAILTQHFSRSFVGRGGDDQAKLRNAVINDERPFVWNERETHFTAG